MQKEIGAEVTTGKKDTSNPTQYPQPTREDAQDLQANHQDNGHTNTHTQETNHNNPNNGTAGAARIAACPDTQLTAHSRMMTIDEGPGQLPSEEEQKWPGQTEKIA